MDVLISSWTMFFYLNLSKAQSHTKQIVFSYLMWLVLEHISMADESNEHSLQHRIGMYMFMKYEVSLKLLANCLNISIFYNTWTKTAQCYIIHTIRELRLHNVISSHGWNIYVIYNLLLNEYYWITDKPWLYFTLSYF